MTRLVVVSNRVPDPEKSSMAGGLAVGLQGALEKTGGLWFGWSGKIAEAPPDTPRFRESGNVTYATLDLTETDYQEYYFGFANRALWPLFHYRGDLTTYDRDILAGYQRVNTLFAKRLNPLLEPDDVLWIHDYHLIPLGAELRKLSCRNPIGFFLHIPFPVPEVFSILPCHDYLMRALFEYDVVGLQTENDRYAFRENAVRLCGAEVGEDGIVKAGQRRLKAEAFPIGIDTENFAGFAEAPVARNQAERMRQSLDGRKLITGVDRLDYTKGLVSRMSSFEQMLDEHPELRGRVSMLQVAPPSRSDVPEYVELRHDLDATTGRINGRFGEFDWVPLRYITKGFSRPALAGLLRASRVGFITPLRDGMNLVAKEYIAAQDEDDPGVLILSCFAGAAVQLDGAIIVNPYDLDAMAEALIEALSMSRAERKDRWSGLIKGIQEADIHHWRRAFLDTLLEARQGL